MNNALLEQHLVLKTQMFALVKTGAKHTVLQKQAVADLLTWRREHCTC